MSILLFPYSPIILRCILVYDDKPDFIVYLNRHTLVYHVHLV